MKGKNAILAILREYPELAEPQIKDEIKAKLTSGKSNKTYFKGITIEELKNISQNNLFKNNLEEIIPSYNCACTA